MSFLYPWFLSLLVPMVIYILQRGYKQSLAQNMRWVALGLLIIALSRPVIKESKEKKDIEVHSIIIALDVSASMRAEDIKPNRISATKESIKLFLAENKKELVSLIAFTTNPLLLAPPTIDHNLVSTALDTLNEKYILTKGTDIKNLLKKVAKFPMKERLLILFSDGGDEMIDDDLLSFIEDNDIKILTIAVATKLGSPIRIDKNELLRDKKGHIVISKLNSELYKLGEVVLFSSPKDTADTIQEWIKKQDISADKLGVYSSNYFELFFIPTFLALVLVFLSGTRFIKKVVWLLLFLGVSNVEAYDIFDSYYLNRAYTLYQNGEYNSTLEILENLKNNSLEEEMIRANSYYKLKDYKKAKSIWSSIKTTKPKIKQQIFYNIGNCEAQLAYYSKAKEAYIKALAFGEDKDILYNLGVVILLKEKYSSKLGVTNPKSPHSTNSSNNNSETKAKQKNQKEKKGSSSGGGDSKTNKVSTTKVKSNNNSSAKKEMSSKAYDLINEGYIHEEKPW